MQCPHTALYWPHCCPSSDILNSNQNQALFVQFSAFSSLLLQNFQTPHINSKSFWTTWSDTVTKIFSVSGINFLYWSAFQLLGQQTWHLHLKGEEVILAHDFGNLVQCRSIMVEGHRGKNCSVHKTWEAHRRERSREKGARNQTYSSRSCSSWLTQIYPEA